MNNDFFDMSELTEALENYDDLPASDFFKWYNWERAVDWDKELGIIDDSE